MAVGDYLRIIRERWLVILAGLLVGVLGAVLFNQVAQPQYSAKATIYITTLAPTATNTAAYEAGQLSAQRVTSYLEVLESRRVSQEVVQNLGLPMSADELSRRVTGSAEPDTVLLTATVTDSSPERAAQLANAVAASFTRVVAELEQNPGSPPLVAARLVQPATPPASPTSLSPPAVLVLGALIGLLGGFVVASWLHRLDTTVKSAESLRSMLGVPNLGEIVYDRDLRSRPLTVYLKPHSARAEAFRQLRTNLQFLDIDAGRKMFVITSSVPGEGKTTTLCNLAIALADSGHRVLVVEADLRRPLAADQFGIDRAVGLTNVLAAQVPVDRAVRPWGQSRLAVLPSGPLPPNPSELLASQQMAHLLEGLRADYDYVLLDTPPLNLVTDAAAVAPRTNGVILICQHGKTTRNEILASVRAIENVGAPLLGTVLTMTPRAPVEQEHLSYYAAYATTAGAAAQPPIPPDLAAEVAEPRDPSRAEGQLQTRPDGGPPSWPPSPVPRPRSSSDSGSAPPSGEPEHSRTAPARPMVGGDPPPDPARRSDRRAP